MEAAAVQRAISPVLSLLSFLINTYNCFLIAAKSPVGIARYRIYMFDVTVCCLYLKKFVFLLIDTIFTIVLAIFQPEPLMPIFAGVVHGPLKYIEVSASWRNSTANIGHIAVGHFLAWQFDRWAPCSSLAPRCSCFCTAHLSIDLWRFGVEESFWRSTLMW